MRFPDHSDLGVITIEGVGDFAVSMDHIGTVAPPPHDCLTSIAINLSLSDRYADATATIARLLATLDVARSQPTGNAEALNAIDAAHLLRQMVWSERTFGPGPRTAGVLDHIRKELREIEEDPGGLEWIDVVILALDGAWRSGHGPQEIIDAIIAKQTRNETRTWPDWRSMPPDQAIEHVRAATPAPQIDVERLRKRLALPEAPPGGASHPGPGAMTRWVLHWLRHPRHQCIRWGLTRPGLVCITCDKEWLPDPRWYRVLDR